MAGLAYKDAFIHIKGFDKNGNRIPLRFFVEWQNGLRREYKNEKSAKSAIRYRLNKGL